MKLKKSTNNASNRLSKVESDEDGINLVEEKFSNENISSSSVTIDNFLNLYCKWSSSASLSERGIKLMQWSFWFLSQVTKDRQEFSKELSPSLRKVYSDLSIMRFVLRLYGMPVALDAIRNGSWQGGEWKDGNIKKLTNIMAWNMLIYYPLEHIALAKWMMPKLFLKLNGNRFSAWSCRFWMAFIVADYFSAYLKNRELLD